VKVAGEMQVDIFHRHDLRIAAACRAALDSEARAERGLTKAAHGLLADAVQSVREADRRRGLAFAGRCRADGRDEDQLAVRTGVECVDEIERELRFGGAVGNDGVGRDSEFRRNLGDRPHLGFARDLDI
jgi:hypothetical protein